MKKVRPGQPLQVPAGTFNSFIDAAEDFKARTRGKGQGPPGGGLWSRGDGGRILVRNDSGATADRFAILGVDTIVIAESANSDQFKSRPLLSVIAPAVPTHSENFVVLAEPLRHEATVADRPIGEAVIDGITVAQIDVQNAAHNFAIVVNAQSTKFESAVDGPIQIIYKDGGTGDKWAVVRLGGRRSHGFHAEITGNATNGTNRWKYAWSEVYKSGAGYGNWSALSGGRSGTTGTNPARNSIEDMNTGVAAHVEGCGVDVDHLDTGDWTFEIMPCTTGNVVWIEEVPYGTGFEYWFSHVNSTDGTCD